MAVLPPHVGGNVRHESAVSRGQLMMRHAVIRVAFATLLAVAAGAPARAADPIFPPNSRIGLVPPPGFSPSMKFPGFEHAQGSAAILLVEIPAEAFAELEKSFEEQTDGDFVLFWNSRDMKQLRESGLLML